MRVLLIHDYGVPVGGAEHMSLALRDGLRQRGHDARLFTSRARPLALDNLADYTCYGSVSSTRRVLQIANPSAVWELSRVLRSFQPDVVHVRMFYTQLSPLILPLLRNYPSLLHVVNYDLICPLNTKVLPDGSPCRHRAGLVCHRTGCQRLVGVARATLQARLRQRWQDVFDLVVANSDWTRRRLQDDGIQVQERVWNGVPVREARAALGRLPIVAFCGRFYRKKGIDVLLRAMVRVTAALPEARLLLAGDGPERPDVEALISDLAIRSHVTLLGYRPRQELEAVLAGAWVQAVPSRWEEPFGLVAAEAMMRGTAVVASRSGGLSEQVIDGETGFTVAPDNADALADALLCILSDRGLAERMGESGRRRALAEFNEACAVARFEKLYERLVQARKQPSAQRNVPAVRCD